MIKNTELAEVSLKCLFVSQTISDNDFLDRDAIASIRIELTRALARINAVERMVVGVPVPKVGEQP